MGVRTEISLTTLVMIADIITTTVIFNNTTAEEHPPTEFRRPFNERILFNATSFRFPGAPRRNPRVGGVNGSASYVKKEHGQRQESIGTGGDMLVLIPAEKRSEECIERDRQQKINCYRHNLHKRTSEKIVVRRLDK